MLCIHAHAHHGASSKAQTDQRFEGRTHGEVTLQDLENTSFLLTAVPTRTAGYSEATRSNVKQFSIHPSTSE